MSTTMIKSTSIVGIMTLISRISGLVRDIVFANLLGDKLVADVFFIAFRIPNFFRRIFAEGAFSVAFVPVFTEYRLYKSKEQNQVFLQLLMGKFGLIFLACSLIGVLFAPIFVLLLASGFCQHPEKFNLTVNATRLTFPYLFLMFFVVMSSGMLNTCGRFAAPAVTPVFLNLSLILSAVFLVPYFENSPIALSIGTLIAGIVQLLFQIPFLRKEKLTIYPRFRVKNEDKVGNEGVNKVFKLILPAIFGMSVAQVNIVINTILASFMETGSIAWLYYSDRLIGFPIGVFGIALSTAILPNLSKKYSKRSGHQAEKEFSSSLNLAIKLSLLLCIPSTFGLSLLSHPVITTIYFYGDFTETGVNMSAYSLIAYSIGLPAIVIVKVLAPSFYAQQNTTTPVKIGMISVCVNIVFSLILFYPLQHVGLALSTSISSIVNAGLLYVNLKKQEMFSPSTRLSKDLLTILIASSVMGLYLIVGMSTPESWLFMGMRERIIRLSGLIAGGALIYFVILSLSGQKITLLFRSSGE